MKAHDIFEEQKDALFDGILFHGSHKMFDKFSVDSSIGAFFTTDISYARHYGSIIYKCRVRLYNPKRREAFEKTGGNYTNSRDLMIREGYDGVVVAYADGAYDAIAFFPEQIDILDVIR